MSVVLLADENTRRIQSVWLRPRRSPEGCQMLSHANKISFKQSWKIYEYFLRTKVAPEIPIRLNLLSNYVFVYAFDFSLVIV